MKHGLILLGMILTVAVAQAQINCPPNLPLTMNGNTEYCIGSAGAELWVVQNYAGYEWLPTAETGQNVLLTAGNYQLVVTHYTGCTDTLAFEVEQVSNPPQPTVMASSATEFCEGGSVILSGPEGYPYYLWNSGSISQDITVHESGTFVLSIIDWLGCSSSSNSIQVIVNPLPTAAFSPDLELYDIGFNNLSLDATTYEWNFGDGATSTDFEPTHSFSTNGTVDMYLVASNTCGNDTAFLTLESVSVEEFSTIQDIAIYPNPTAGEFNIQFTATQLSTVSVSMVDLLGRQLFKSDGSVRNGTHSIPVDLTGTANGLYTLVIETEEHRTSRLVQICTY
ncbi:MAG: hypothetical protein RL266_2315 [Bacteroidota bacterium]|jgi:hypothetical protein